MNKKWISLLLVAVMLLTAAPFALAEEDTTPSPTPTATPEVWATPEATPTPPEATPTATPEATPTADPDPTPKKTTLTATGGTFPYDGKAHKVTYTLVNGEDYKNVYFSVDGGETWTKTAPSLTKVGKLTVTVRAVKEGGKDPLTVQVKLEVTDAAAEGTYVTIYNCNSSANVREKANKNSKKLGEAKKGKTFKLLGVEGNWYKIQFTADTEGYVSKTYAKVGKSGGDPDPTPTGDTGTVVNAKNAVNVRAKASSSSKKLGRAKNGDVFTVLGVSGKWVKVEYEGGVAYIYGHYMKLSNSGGSKPTPTPTPTPKPKPVAGEKGYIVNVKTQVNVRKEPNSNSKLLGVLKKGAEVSVTGTSGKWTEIVYKDGVAYVFSDYVSATKPGDELIGRTFTIVKVKNYTSVRAKAKSSSAKLGEAKKGEKFVIQGVSGSWYKVNFDGITGFIYKKYTKLD